MTAEELARATLALAPVIDDVAKYIAGGPVAEYLHQLPPTLRSRIELEKKRRAQATKDTTQEPPGQ